MADAEELMRSAPRATVPWSQGISAYLPGALLAGRIADLLAAIALLRDVDPAPDAVGKVVMSLLNGVCILDTIGHLGDGTALEDRFHTVVDSAGEGALMTRFWWNVAIGMRAAYAHEDPWRGLVHTDEIRPIFDVTGSELHFLNLQLFRGLNLWYLGAFGSAERSLEACAAADEALGVASYLRRLGLAWLRADRGALEEARALAARGLGSRTANAQSAARFIQQHQTIIADRIKRWIGDSDKREIHQILRQMQALCTAEHMVVPDSRRTEKLIELTVVTTWHIVDGIHRLSYRADVRRSVQGQERARDGAGCG
jgi:hypothetical protein